MALFDRISIVAIGIAIGVAIVIEIEIGFWRLLAQSEREGRLRKRPR